MSNYLPCCKYLHRKTGMPYGASFIFNMCAPAAANFVLHLKLALHTNLAPGSGGLIAFAAPVSTLIGIFATKATEAVLPRILSKKGIGLSRGGQILRAAQIAAYTGPMLCSLGFFGALSIQNAQNKSPDEQIKQSNPMAETQQERLSDSQELITKDGQKIVLLTI